MDSDTLLLFFRHRLWKLGRPGSSSPFAALSFTLVEMLVAITVLSVLLVLAAQVITRTSSVWMYSNYKMTQGRDARVAFSSLVARLGEATVDQYYGYTNYVSGTAALPGNYLRRSELRFASGLATNLIPTTTVVNGVGMTNLVTDATFFVAPLGIVTNTTLYAHLPSLLNVCGYYVQWSNIDSERPSPPLPTGNGIYRFRLMQFVQPSESMSVYSQTIPFSGANVNGNYPLYTNLVTSPSWQITALQNSYQGIHPLANNVVALLLLPATNVVDSSGVLATNFLYNTEKANTGATGATTSLNRTPPVMRVVMYTIDEKSALRLTQSATVPPLYVYSGSGLFVNSSKLYTNSTTGDIGDLARFEATLTANKLTYRRFDAAVELPRQPWNTNN